LWRDHDHRRAPDVNAQNLRLPHPIPHALRGDVQVLGHTRPKLRVHRLAKELLLRSAVTGQVAMASADDERVRVLQSAIERRDRELQILSVVASRIHGEDDPTAILEIALDEILDGTGLQAAWIFLGDQREKRLHLAAHRGISSAYLEEVRRDGLGACLCPEVFWSGHRMVARNTTQCPRMPHIVEGQQAPTAHACIPLRFEGGARGVLNLAAAPDRLFEEEELSFLETLGHQICLAVERATHLNAERMRNQEARALAAINKAIGGSLDVEAVLQAVGDTARELLGADRALVFLGREPARLTVAHLSGLPHPELVPGQPLDLPALEARLQLRAIESRQLLTVHDWSSDPRVNRELALRWGMGSAIVAPLLARKEVLGLLLLTRSAAHRWSEEQIDVADALAAQASVALENARLFEDTRRAYRKLKEAQSRTIQAEKLAMLGTFASGLAHEVRNPLNSISLQLSILERRAAPLEEGLAGQIRGLIGIIREEVRRLENLVSDFLQFSRTSRVHYQSSDLGALTDEVVSLLQPEASGAGVTLRRQQVGEPLPALQLDAERMKQVVLNLVRNAIEAMPEGGVVTLEEGLREGRAQLVVRDSGPGLPHGLDVFQLFVTTKAKGTGLGLPIAQQIVLEHGGEISAASQPGQGAAFTVSLPLNAGDQASKEAFQP
jgi:signal transduction histidine kinase